MSPNTPRLRRTLVESDKKPFKKMFPNLAKELGGENTIPIDSVRTNADDAEKSMYDRFHNYDPTVVDFIRRCSTETEADEIIVFMEKRGELTGEHAQQLRKQLKEKGVRSFGRKKEPDYYFKHGGLC